MEYILVCLGTKWPVNLDPWEWPVNLDPWEGLMGQLRLLTQTLMVPACTSASSKTLMTMIVP